MSGQIIGKGQRRVLVACPSWVGDAVMATPAMRGLRAALPGSELIGLVRPGLDELLAGTPWLDAIITAGPRGLWSTLTTARRLKGKSIDAAILLPNSFRSALTAALAAIPIRVGYDRDRRGFLLTHPIPIESPRAPTPAVDAYLHLVGAAVGVTPSDRRLKLTVSPDEQAEANRLLDEVPRPFVLINPGAVRQDKRWPAERFARVAMDLAQRHHMGVAITGSPAEAPLLEAVEAAAPGGGVVNLARRGIRLSGLKAVLQAAALLITNDTGPRHIAAAVGTPTVALFGPTDHRWTTLCGARERLLLADPFLPDELTADRFPKRCRIDRIPVSDVIDAAEALLEIRRSDEATK